jgi:hypothetical protein
MVDLYRHCTWNLNPRATSIDTPLHAFVPRAHVDHTHPNALIAIAACTRGEDVMREVFGTQLRWLPWMLVQNLVQMNTPIRRARTVSSLLDGAPSTVCYKCALW